MEAAVKRSKSMVAPIFARLFFDVVVGLLKSIRRRFGDVSPRHDESRARRSLKVGRL